MNGCSLGLAALLLTCTATSPKLSAVQAPTTPAKLDEKQLTAEKLNSLKAQLPSDAEVKSINRFIELQQLFCILGDIESTEVLIEEVRKNGNPAVRAGLGILKNELEKSKGQLAKFERSIKNDPSLIIHAKAILAEYRRLDAIYLQMGEMEYSRKGSVKERALKLTEYMKKFDKPEPVDPKKEPGTPK